ncbi:peptidylprolyl isomerase [Desulfobotulus sp.]|jgi:peptidylprolyl isomerase|uniref:FKBP-type peptidyl-prolyl cis-trans isomerase n=1 Tax=Desulfobotulus sp. TaxID=1940337 RepID=UPI002A3720AF|nr:peptidylprolyl isomerase [Desulfobotulus sp.]MDY0163795.1 peptidylprolyl isomerase [Desulfobotulus sp.]
MRKAEKGDRVQVHYTGKFPEGEVFDSSEGRSPLSFELGGGQMIPGFDAAVLGMSVGEKKSVTLLPEEAYGPHNPDLVAVYEKSLFPEGMEIQEGMILESRMEDGTVIPIRIAAIEGENVTVDANFPMAGKTLVFDLELVSIA